MFIQRVAWYLLLSFSLIASADAQKRGPAEWTLMIFMNGDNDLERFALQDFEEMAKIGSTDEVNVIVQFDRSPGYSDAHGDWTGTLRFRVEKGMPPIPANAVEDLGEANMGDGEVLRDFVVWAQERYPAKRNALIIWNHGQGWRMQMATNIVAPNDAERPALTNFLQARKSADASDATMREQQMPSLAFYETVPGTMRSVSTDSSSGDTLYMREIQDVLRPIVAARPLDVIGFDACLMAMVESAYAMRGLAQVMVASEELEPGPGWNYEILLRKITSSPAMDARAMGRAIVKAFEDNYGPNGPDDDETTTLSAIDLGQLSSLAGHISILADRLVSFVKSNPGTMRRIRGSDRVAFGYIHGYRLEYSVDLDFLAEKLIAETGGDDGIVKAARDVRGAVQSAVLANFAGRRAAKERGARGISIYFPPTKFYFERVDRDYLGYLESNTVFPVEFVQHHRWANFLVGSYFVDTPGP